MSGMRLLFVVSAVAGALVTGLSPSTAAAQPGGCGDRAVNPSNQQGWSPLDGVAPEFVDGPTGATDDGSIELKVTDNSQKVDYYQFGLTSLADATGLGFRVNTTAGASASYQFKVIGANRTDGSALGFTSLVWDRIPSGPTAGWVDATALESGQWWSTQSIAGATGGQANPVSLAQIKAANPGAQIYAYGVNVGTGAGGSTSYVDSLQFGCINWEFAPDPTPGSSGSLGSSASSASSGSSGSLGSSGSSTGSLGSSTNSAGGSVGGSSIDVTGSLEG